MVDEYVGSSIPCHSANWIEGVGKQKNMGVILHDERDERDVVGAGCHGAYNKVEVFSCGTILPFSFEGIGSSSF